MDKVLNKPESLDLTNYTQVSGESAKYRIHEDGGLIYNMLSKEAESAGTLGKYDDAKKKTAKLILDNMEVEIQLPTEFTAYDMIPIDYKITKSGSVKSPVTIEAVAYEEAGRYDGTCYDLTIPGSLVFHMNISAM